MEGLEQRDMEAISQTEKTRLTWQVLSIRAYVTNWRYISYASSITTLLALVCTTWLLITAKPTEKPLKETIKPYREIIVEVGELTYEERKATITTKSLADLAKISEGLAKPIFRQETIV